MYSQKEIEVLENLSDPIVPPKAIGVCIAVTGIFSGLGSGYFVMMVLGAIRNITTLALPVWAEILLAALVGLIMSVVLIAKSDEQGIERIKSGAVFARQWLGWREWLLNLWASLTADRTLLIIELTGIIGMMGLVNMAFDYAGRVREINAQKIAAMEQWQAKDQQDQEAYHQFLTAKMDSFSRKTIISKGFIPTLNILQAEREKQQDRNSAEREDYLNALDRNKSAGLELANIEGIGRTFRLSTQAVIMIVAMVFSLAIDQSTRHATIYLRTIKWAKRVTAQLSRGCQVGSQAAPSSAGKDLSSVNVDRETWKKGIEWGNPEVQKILSVIQQHPAASLKQLRDILQQIYRIKRSRESIRIYKQAALEQGILTPAAPDEQYNQALNAMVAERLKYCGGEA